MNTIPDYAKVGVFTVPIQAVVGRTITLQVPITAIAPEYEALLEAVQAALSVLRNFTMYDGHTPDHLVVLAQEAAKRCLAAIGQVEERST